MSIIERFQSERENVCLCDVFSCEFIGVVDDTPKRKLKDD